MTTSFSFVAGRVSARRPTHFLLLRQEKVSKEKATRVRVSLRYAKGNLRCSQQAGGSQTRFAQTCEPLFPPVAALLGTRTRAWEADANTDTNTKDTRTGALLARAAVLSPTPLGRAEQRSVGRIRAGACLSEASLRQTPPNVSSAGNPAGARSTARLLFAYFVVTNFASKVSNHSVRSTPLAKQEKTRYASFAKVSRPPGRDPACPAKSNPTQEAKTKC
jgi:hypothetical protein